MFETYTLWLWIGTVGMTLGTLPPLKRAFTDAKHRSYYAVLASIPGIAAVAYLAMALGYGFQTVDGAVFFVPRYVDWLLTTPLLVLYLGMLCRPSKQVYAALLGLDVVVILSGVTAVFLGGLLGIAVFGVGCVAFAVLAYLLVVGLQRRAVVGDDRVETVFTKLRNLTVVLWSLYPVVWVLSGPGLGLLNPSTEILVVTYLDLITKVGFVAIAVNGSDALDRLTNVRGRTDSATRRPGSTAD